jgi:hypothetical protein
VDSFFLRSKSLNMVRPLQSVADTSYGFDVPSGVAELLAKPLHVSVHGARFEGSRVTPHGFEQLLAATNQSSVPREVDQELELERRERDCVAIDCDLVPGNVDDEAIELKPIELSARVGLRSAEHGPKPKSKLAGAVRFGDEVVCTELESQDAIDLVVLARHENHWLRSRLRLLADSLEDLRSAHVGELVLENEACNAVPREKPNRALSVPGLLEAGPARSEASLQRCPKRAVTGYDATIHRHHSLRAWEDTVTASGHERVEIVIRPWQSCVGRTGSSRFPGDAGSSLVCHTDVTSESQSRGDRSK